MLVLSIVMIASGGLGRMWHMVVFMAMTIILAVTAPCTAYKMHRAVIHIGPHKTGTSTLQVMRVELFVDLAKHQWLPTHVIICLSPLSRQTIGNFDMGLDVCTH